MKNRNLIPTALCVWLALTGVARAQSPSAITYQGRLTSGGLPANGYYDFKFSLYAVTSGGSPVANPIAKPPLLVTNGLFATTLDFGAAGFPGDNRWLEIAVRPSGSSGNYQTLDPRQRITATPYALQAASVADGAVTAGKLSAGAGPDGQVLKMSGGQLVWGTAGAGGGGVSLVASGTGLTGGPITNTGTLAIDPSIVPQLSAANTFGNPGNSFVGSFTGNGGGLSNQSLATASFVDHGGLVSAGTNRFSFINVMDYIPQNADPMQTRLGIQKALDLTTNSFYDNANTPWQTNSHSVVYFPNGTYYVDGPLFIRVHGTRLIGEGGWGRTRIWQTANTNIFMANPWVGWNAGGATKLWNTVIENLNLVIEPSPTQRAAALYMAQPGGDQFWSRTLLRNVNAVGFYYGIYADHAVGLFAERCDFTGNAHGFYLRKCDMGTFINCMAGGGYGGGDWGVNLTSGWWFERGSAGVDGFNLTLIGCEVGDCVKSIHTDAGNVSILGLNLELDNIVAAHALDGHGYGPALDILANTRSLFVSGMRVSSPGNYGSGTNPVIALAADVGRRTFLNVSDVPEVAYPHVRLAGAGDYINYAGKGVTVTNTADHDGYLAPRFDAGTASLIALAKNDAASLTNLNGANLVNGTVNSNKLDVATRALLGLGGSGFDVAQSNAYYGSFTGNGAGLTNLSGATATNYNGAGITNLNASNIASGTLGDARLSANVGLRNANQTFTGANTFGNPANSFVGSFTGNGAGLTNLSGATSTNYNGASITNLNAANIASGTLNDARLSANVALRNANQTFTGSNTFAGGAAFTSGANLFAGSFVGNGAGLTNITASLTNALAGDVTGPANATTVARLRGVNLSAVAPNVNQHLRFDGANWTPGAVTLATDISGVLGIANGGTAASTAPAARLNLGAAASGANTDINSLAGLTTPLSAGSGGSGQSAYTVGDLLYANGTASLAKLSDAAAGNALISGGIGVAPFWGKVGLTTHVGGTLPLANGGTAATTAATARGNLGAAASGANGDITALAGLTTPLSASQGGSGFSSYSPGDLLFANTPSSLARLADTSVGNALISGGAGQAPLWGKVGLTTHVSGTLPVGNGGTGATTAPTARGSLGAAASGANSDITSLTGLTTPLAPTQGGSGQSAYSAGDLLFASAANTLARRAIGVAGQVLASRGGVPVWTNANDHDHFGQVWSGTTVDGLYVQNTSATDGASAYAGIVTANSSVNYGVFGQTSSSQGTGVQGLALATSGFATGISGESASADGAGVYGLATAASGTNSGVFGDSTSPLGTGVFGRALATTGTPVGVYGYSAAATGYGFYTPSRLYVGNNAFVGGHLTIGTGSRIQADPGTTNLPGITFFGNLGVGMFSPATNVLGFATSGSQRMQIAADGKTGIGRVAATNRFEVEGEASKATAGGWLANSDAAIKTEVHSLSGALDQLDRVRPVAFRYTADYLQKHPDIENKVYYNVIAQEFAEVFPESVKSSGEMLNGKNILQVDTHPATMLSIAAIQELRRLVQSKNQELTELRNQNEKLEARLSALERRMAKGE